MHINILKIMKSKMIHNTGWIMFAQIYQMLLSLIIGVLCARYLGPTNYGILNYAASYISFFSITCALGLEGIVVKEIIDNRDIEGTVLGTSILMRFIAGALSMVAVCIIVAVINPGDPLLVKITFLQSLVLLFNAFHIIDTWYQSLLKSKVSSIIKCISYTIMSLYRIWLLLAKKGVIWFAFSTSLDALIIAVLFLYAYKKDGVHTFHVSEKMAKRLIGLSYHLIISSLMAVLYNQMDKIMIGKIIDHTHVGYYTAASTICQMWLFIPQALSNSARPIIMELKDKNPELYIRRIKQLTSATCWMGIIFALIVSSLSNFIINVLYGEEFYSARGPLLLMIWSTVFSSLSFIRAVWMISENKQKYIKNILAVGLLVNLVFNFVFIPLFGMNGAALATLITEITGCFIAPLLYKETRVFVTYVLSSLNIFKQFKNI